MRQTAQRLGLTVVAQPTHIRRKTRSYRSIDPVRKADCVVYTGITANGAVRLFRGVGRSLRKAQLFAATASPSPASPAACPLRSPSA